MNEDDKRAAQMLRDLPMARLLDVVLATVTDGLRLAQMMAVNESTRVLLQAELDRRKAQAAEVPSVVSEALQRLGAVAP